MLEEIVFFSIIINKSLCAGGMPQVPPSAEKTSLGLPVFPFFAIYLYKGVWL